MTAARQLGFQILEKQSLKFFGGSYLKNSHAKIKRPVSTKKAMHVVLRSSLAKGKLSLLKKENELKALIGRQGRLHGVKVYRQANGGNHIHLIILPGSRIAFNNFVRAISGLIARRVTGSEKGKANQFSFWDKRPFSRILEWGRDFKTASRYLLQNTLEAWGFIPYTPRKPKRKAPQ